MKKKKKDDEFYSLEPRGQDRFLNQFRILDDLRLIEKKDKVAHIVGYAEIDNEDLLVVYESVKDGIILSTILKDEKLLEKYIFWNEFKIAECLMSAIAAMEKYQHNNLGTENVFLAFDKKSNQLVTCVLTDLDMSIPREARFINPPLLPKLHSGDRVPKLQDQDWNYDRFGMGLILYEITYKKEHIPIRNLEFVIGGESHIQNMFNQNGNLAARNT